MLLTHGAIYKYLEKLELRLIQASFKKEIESMKPGSLPLENGLTQGGYIGNNNITATILSTSDESSVLNTKVGVFFTEIVGGCNCNDDPFEINAYCEMVISIDKATAKGDIIALES